MSVYEPIIRHAAGMGRAPTDPDPDHYAFEYAHCDVAVVGAGPAGLAAALAASRAGARVIAVRRTGRIRRFPARRDARLDRRRDGVRLARRGACRTRRFAARDHAAAHADLRLLRAELPRRAAAPDRSSRRLPTRRCRASGCGRCARAKWCWRPARTSAPLVFPDNDRPGIMLAEAARTLATRYGVKPGTRIVVATAHDSAYRAALDLAEAGCEIAMIADLRAEADGPLPEAARRAGLRVEANAAIVGSYGSRRVTHALVAKRWADGRAGQGRADRLRRRRDERRLDAERQPLFAIARQSSPSTKRRRIFCPAPPCRISARRARAAAFSISRARSPTARTPARRRRASRRRAPPRVEGRARGDGRRARARRRRERQGASPRPSSISRTTSRARDIQLATREGMRSIEHIKRYTTTGMATDQGKNSNLNALAIAAEALGKPIAEVGLTTFRPPYTPVTFGDLRRPRAPRHVRSDPRDAAARAGRRARARSSRRRACGSAPPISPGAARASTTPCGANAWRRAPAPASWTPRRSARSRSSAPTPPNSSIASTSIRSPSSAVGRCRYGLMLTEDGYIYDDGVVMRLAADRFHITTTSSGAARVFAVMEDYLQTEWSDLKVWFTSITEQFATIAINGPNARKILAPLVSGIDLANAAFPHMSVREGLICGAPTRLARVSFTGELGFEVNVPADFGESVARGDLGRGREGRRRRLRPGDAAYPARRKRLHRRRPGHRRHDDAGRCRHGQDGRLLQARFHRQALADAARPEARGPQATRGAAAGRPDLQDRRGRADRRRRGAADRNARARPRLVLLHERRRWAAASRSLWWPTAARGSARRSSPRRMRPRRRSSSSSRSSTTGKGCALTPDAAMPQAERRSSSPGARLARHRQGQGRRLAVRDALRVARRAGRRRPRRRRVRRDRRRCNRCAPPARDRAPRCGWARTNGC